MYAFKLEGGGGGGEWFKEGFHKLFGLKWNSFEKTWFKIQLAKNTKQFNTTLEKLGNPQFTLVHS